MALPAVMLDMVCQAAKEQGGGAACSAGYPDLLVSPQQLDDLLGAGASSEIPVRADSARILAWHGVTKLFDRVYDTVAVFRKLGYSLDVIDIHAARGNEIILDLNHPLPADFATRYDLVLDTGTCEHCFNIGQAAINLASLVKRGGIIIQAMPLNVFNHGFYNVNPTWFHDFYPANGFQFQYLQAITNIVWDPKTFEVPAFDRFREAPPNSIMIAVVVRKEVVPLKLPTQHKYQMNPGLGT